jgi:hypothetical protein
VYFGLALSLILAGFAVVGVFIYIPFVSEYAAAADRVPHAPKGGTLRRAAQVRPISWRRPHQPQTQPAATRSVPHKWQSLRGVRPLPGAAPALDAIALRRLCCLDKRLQLPREGLAGDPCGGVAFQSQLTPDILEGAAAAGFCNLKCAF